MLHKISNNIISYSLTAVLGCMGFIYFVHPEFISIEKNSPYALLNFENTFSAFWSTFLFCMVAVIAFGVVKTINSNYKFVEGSIIPMALFYIISFLSIPFYAVSLATSVGILFSLLSLSIILKVHNQTVIRGELFLSGLFIGLASLFFYPSLLFILLIFSAVTLFRPFELRNYFISLIGFILPIIYWLGASYLFDVPILFSKTNLEIESISTPQLNFHSIPAFVSLILGVTGGLTIFFSNAKFIVRQRNQLVLITFYLILLFVFPFFTSISQLSLAALPILSLFFLYFYRKLTRKWIVDLLLLLLVLSSIWLKV